MPGSATTVQGAQPIEYAEETNFAGTSSSDLDVAYNWFGLVNSFSVTQGVEAENVRYLPADGDATKLENVENVKVSEAYSAEVTWHPQSIDELQYWTGASGGVDDALASLNIGEQNEDSGEFRNIVGAVAEEVTLTIDEDSVAEFSGSFVAADATDWSTSDYVGTGGSHATANTSDPWTFDDLGNITLGGASLGDSVNSLTLTVSNDLEVVKDPDAGRNSQIAAIVPTSREISVELGLTYDDMSMAQEVRNYTAKQMQFDFPTGTSGYTFTVSDVQFPEFPYEFAPEDLVGDTVSSDPATDLSWA